MKKKSATIISVVSFLLLTYMILCYPAKCLSFAFLGLDLWFRKMIPALFPFMVFSGIMIRMNLTDSFVKILSPLFRPLYRISKSGIYVLFVGFLCGFPMGAHTIAELYKQNKISKQEAEYLLAFCNNIGPVYVTGFALPILGVTQIKTALFGMYGIPLLYGLFLRRLQPYGYFPCTAAQKGQKTASTPFLEALDESVMSALNGITRLGGYMIIFNLLNIVPTLLLKTGEQRAVFACILEITGGLSMLWKSMPLYTLSLLAFGGLSCIAQTNSMLQGTDLSLKKYVFHKTILTAVSFVYYCFAAFLSCGT